MPARIATSSSAAWKGACRRISAFPGHIQALLANPQKVATRKASELALEAINAALPETLGGSADLTGSNNTKTKAQKPLTRDDYSGRYIYYGIREFGMSRR
jgi:transketolase